MTTRTPYRADRDQHTPPACPDCAVPLGSLHDPGCDVERCHHERQAISCDDCGREYCAERGFHDWVLVPGAADLECRWCDATP
ncbi:hypothetical protein SEA_SIXAMA_88 [Gordonia phage Sixama]|uniref:Uncharacterized protein n=1 Tax=Gordonia phage Sixama TaxID=2653271 RepID=A0A5Q2F459_9CAUD|nr:hypothetical protein PP302_gp088 [Gordonia phage Sixama]QGF20267.1 hypothetical protein SEA_SIXAMA_88 [Gordonia phage Sixama]